MGHNVQGVWRDLQSSTNFVITKLFTKEDPVYLHKILGLLALISFYYRYALLRVPGGGLGFGVANWTWFDAITIGLHLALSFSSIIFHVLRHRILTKPLIIYEEVQIIVDTDCRAYAPLCGSFMPLPSHRVSLVPSLTLTLSL